MRQLFFEALEISAKANPLNIACIGMGQKAYLDANACSDVNASKQTRKLFCFRTISRLL
jgi:hypothetical protein